MCRANHVQTLLAMPAYNDSYIFSGLSDALRHYMFISMTNVYVNRISVYLFNTYLLKYIYTGCLHISNDAILKICALSYIQ